MVELGPDCRGNPAPFCVLVHTDRGGSGFPLPLSVIGGLDTLNCCIQWRTRVLAWVLLPALLLGFLPPAFARAQAPADATWLGCETVAAETLRDELNRVSQTIFAGDAQTLLDLDRLVERQWARVGMDAAIDRAVADAVAQVRGDTDFWNQLVSGWSPSHAETLTRRVADLAFASTTFQDAIDRLADAVAVELAAAVAQLSAESATQATLCLQSYIGTRYSDAMVATFTRQVQQETAALDLAASQGLDAGILTVMDRHRAAVGGVGVIIATQVARRVVSRLGETVARRVAGRVAGRVVGRAGAAVIPAVGWIVGAGLIVYDLIESRDGALPQIQSGLQSSEVKAAIRSEITAVVADELRLEMPQLARDIANDLFASWQDFQRQYRQLLTLADGDPAFRALLTAAEEPAKLAVLADAVLTGLGADALQAALADDSLARALELPERAYAMLRGGAPVARLLEWSALAGSRLEDVVTLEVYKHKSPADFTRDELTALLAVQAPDAIATLLLLDKAALNRMLTLATPHVVQLARTLSPEELSWLAGYLAILTQDQANQLVRRVLDDPAVLTPLQDARVQAQVAASRDVDATLRFLTTPLTLMGWLEDWLQMATGRVGFGLAAAKYGTVLAGLMVGLPVLLLLAVVYSLVSWLLRPIVALLRALGWVVKRRDG